jgi:hypothetical protein
MLSPLHGEAVQSNRFHASVLNETVQLQASSAKESNHLLSVRVSFENPDFLAAERARRAAGHTEF